MDEKNLQLYNLLRTVPPEAKKEIKAGRLKGFTDINPMWRIKRLTEVFGPCGKGWWYVIKGKRLEGEGAEVRAFVDIDLYYVWEGEVSQPIPGTGGSSFLTQERNGAYTSDECYKMALTDAISVSAKAIGLGADVYYEKDRDKYTQTEQPGNDNAPPPSPPAPPGPTPEEAKQFERVMVRVQKIVESVHDLETANAAAADIPNLRHVLDSKRHAAKMLKQKTDALGYIWNKDGGYYINYGKE